MSVPLMVAGAPSRRTTATPRRPSGAGGGRGLEPSTGRSRFLLATTDALFAENVERKVSNPLAHFPAARSFVDRAVLLAPLTGPRRALPDNDCTWAIYA